MPFINNMDLHEFFFADRDLPGGVCVMQTLACALWHRGQLYHLTALRFDPELELQCAVLLVSPHVCVGLLLIYPTFQHVHIWLGSATFPLGDTVCLCVHGGGSTMQTPDDPT